MNTDQARRLVTLHDNADRALANLRNANAMATDDPRATELLEDAGDAYSEAVRALYAEQNQLVDFLDRVEPTAEAPSGAETASAGSGEGQAAKSA